MKTPQLKVAVSTGLYGVARGPELSSIVAKVGYALTRGTNAIEIAGDVPHEIDFTEGWEIRYIAEKQGMDLNFHGSLTTPFEIPEKFEWRQAQDHMEKSVKSAVYGGCKYVDFHAGLREWIELFTYAGARLEMVIADHHGRPMKEILHENEKLRKWFVYETKKNYAEEIGAAIIGPEKSNILFYRARDEVQQKIAEEKGKGDAKTLAEETDKKYKEYLREAVFEHLKEGKDWFREERALGLDDGYLIIANSLYFSDDPIWIEMARMYADILPKFDYDPSKKDWTWVEDSFKKADLMGFTGLKFKEFYYAVVGAKYLQGHLKELAKWMKEELIDIISKEIDMIQPRAPIDKEKEKQVLKKIIEALIIGIENPDARDPSHAGRYPLWDPKQIFVAVKATRDELKKQDNPYWDKIMMIIDFEHIATQGADPKQVLNELVMKVPDIGKYIIAVHSNYPSPLHSHKVIEIGDRFVIYELLWTLTEHELGQDHLTYILYERGGGEDPFKGSVMALRVIVRYLALGVPPLELPPQFYKIPEGATDFARQKVIIFEHAFDPIKGMLRQPEEEFTLLGTAAIKLGKRPEEWKKEELR